MSAAIKATSVLGSLALVGAGTAYTMRQPNTDFTRNALAAAEHSAPDAITAAVKPKLPSNFFQFSVGEYKISNARGL